MTDDDNIIPVTLQGWWVPLPGKRMVAVAQIIEGDWEAVAHEGPFTASHHGHRYEGRYRRRRRWVFIWCAPTRRKRAGAPKLAWGTA